MKTADVALALYPEMLAENVKALKEMTAAICKGTPLGDLDDPEVDKALLDAFTKTCEGTAARAFIAANAFMEELRKFRGDGEAPGMEKR